jgi:GNAT superfamily N-acetyltransferase
MHNGRVREMTDSGIVYRLAVEADMPGISRVRTSVIENLLTVAQLEQRGITNASVATSFREDATGWVAVHDGQIVGFSIADRRAHSIFALFILPAYEGRGIGSHLFNLAVDWLWDNGTQRAWLTTGANTKAAAFYERRGWVGTFAANAIGQRIATASGELCCGSGFLRSRFCNGPEKVAHAAMTAYGIAETSFLCDI